MSNPDKALPSLYPKNQSARLDRELFKNPTSEYRGAPLWSWNNKLDAAQLVRQIGWLQEMGLGGFHIHPRTGLATAYMGDEFLKMVRICADEAKRRGMFCWLYDEDRWPSGYAGGLVTSDPAFRLRHLLWTPRPYGDEPPEFKNQAWALAARTKNGTLLGRYEITLRDNVLAGYRRLAGDEVPSSDKNIWYAYLETSIPIPWYNNQTYVDNLNPAAVRRFIEVTHERYKKVLGDYFGNVVPSIFSDEPQFVCKSCLRSANDRKDVTLPWTGDFSETYAAAYSENIEACLPELFWELPDGEASAVRYHYHDHVTERFARAFTDQVGGWCQKNGIALTGHTMEEPTLETQTHSTGEAMRVLRKFQLPGIDMLCDNVQYTTAKQAQSVAHQYGRAGVLSELYGVTNWDYDFVGHKGQGDWQAALGVTIRVPHLSWVSMAGEAKRDYPASISYQSPWFREYPLIENHFARLNTVLTRGKPRIKIGVIHPIESYWLAYGPLEQTQSERAERNDAFVDLANWLLLGLVDFNYICEALLPELCPEQKGPGLQVGEMTYDVAIVPGLRTIRSGTLDRLERFAEAGGTLLFAGEIPALVDAVPSERAQRLASHSRRVNFSRARILDALEPHRDVDVRQPDGTRCDSILHQIRQDGEIRYAFFCNIDRVVGRFDNRIRIKGAWQPTRLNTFTGEREPLPAEQSDGWTIIPWDFQPHGDLLLELRPGKITQPVSIEKSIWEEIGRLADPVPVTLSEPNVLLLDRAEWKLDEGDWQPREEVLRVENHARTHWKLDLKNGDIPQPWTDTAPVQNVGHVSFRFRIESDVAVASPLLALENPAITEITLDGKTVPSTDTGWWTDEAIRTVALPSLAQGLHELILRLPFNRKSDIEWCYLLGDFGVRVAGSHVRIVAPVRELAFGDWTGQGLPFYGGNVTYHCCLEGSDETLAIAAPSFKAPLLSVDFDERKVGSIAFAPFEVNLGQVKLGEHRIDLTAFGNRINCFGPIHNTYRQLTWVGPDAWRSEGVRYAEEYQLKPMGILAAPIIKKLVT